MIFNITTVTISIISGLVFGAIGVLVAKVITLEEDAKRADYEIYLLKQELRLLKKRISFRRPSDE